MSYDFPDIDCSSFVQPRRVEGLLTSQPTDGLKHVLEFRGADGSVYEGPSSPYMIQRNAIGFLQRENGIEQAREVIDGGVAAPPRPARLPSPKPNEKKRTGLTPALTQEGDELVSGCNGPQGQGSPDLLQPVAESDLLRLPVLNGYGVEIVQRRDTPRELPRQGEE